MSDMIDGNMIALSRYENEVAEFEEANDTRIDLLNWTIGEVEEVRDSIREGADIEAVDEKLIDLIGKLEGER